MKLALSPVNPVVGDIDANVAMIGRAIESARAGGADVIVLPELVITGYPPKDLLLRPSFIARVQQAVEDLAQGIRGVEVVLGCPRVRDGALRNSAAIIRDTSITWHDKRLLPDYDVFDEPRYFTPGDQPTVVELKGRRVGIAICEDLWHGEDAREGGRYRGAADPMGDLARERVDGVIVISASPYVMGKSAAQRRLVERHARALNAWVAEVNQFGANDELVFDGVGVFAPREGGSVTNAFATGAPMIFDVESGATFPRAQDDATLSDQHELVEIITLGIRDYVRKTGHSGAVVGLSGGIDSALVAALAVRALGAANVAGLLMPGPYSSEHSVTDALDLADRLRITATFAPITDIYSSVDGALDAALRGLTGPGARAPGDITDQNLQSRARGITLMGVSNATGRLVLATGNKSELATGYCTLYGDMIGALAPLSDLYKTRVYALATDINARHAELGFTRAPIPDATIRKPPSAELAPNQTDQDTLPPYEVLDAVLERLIEERMSVAEAAADSRVAEQTVARIAQMVRNAEYKRWQLPVGIKLSRAAFGFGRRYPVVSRWAQ